MPVENETATSAATPATGKHGRLSALLRQSPPAPAGGADDVPRDSFNQVISAKDQYIQPDTTPLPSFENGVLRAVNERPVSQLQPAAGAASEPDAPVTTPSPAAPSDTSLVPVASERPPAAGTKPESKTSGVIAAILCVIVAIVLGIAVYALWSRLNVQIVQYKRQAEEWSHEVQALRLQLTGCQEEQQVTEATLPVYVEPHGYYSLYKEIPSLSVTADSNRAQLFYGETDGRDPISGFVMTIEVGETNGRSLQAIVEADYTHAPNGVTNVDMKDVKIAEHIGFSYVAYQNNVDTQYYYLQDTVPSKRYVKVTYRVGASTMSEYDYYNRMAVRMMSLLQLYELD